MAEQAQPKPRARKKKGRGGLIIGIIIIALIAVAVITVLNSSKDEGVEVEVQKVQRRTIVETVTATGAIEPELQVIISPEVSGEITYLGVEEGDQVEKGQVLVRINPESILAEREQANATILAGKARTASAKANLLKAQQELARMQKLFEKKLSTQQELDNAQAQVDISQAELEASQYQVEQSQANYRQVQESLKKTTITAPISGVVTKLNSKVGEKVVGAIQMTGTEIMTIADLAVIEAVVDVVETDVVQIDLDDTAEIEVDALPDEKYLAVVSKIANSPTQSGTGTEEQLTNFEVRLRFITPDERFRPGMTATATIRTEVADNVLSIPIQSVTTRRPTFNGGENGGGGAPGNGGMMDRRGGPNGGAAKPKPIVFTVTNDSASAVSVETGIRDDQFIEIKSGLNGDETVVSGSYKAITKDLSDGDKVIVNSKGKKGPAGTRPQSEE